LTSPKASYSQATVFNHLVHCSGSIGIGLDRQFVSNTFSGQAKQVLANLTAVLEAAGCSLNDVLKVTILLTDMAHYAEINAIYAAHFPQPLPARSCFAVLALPLGALIEIEATAVRRSKA